jgi:hypothetical protein
MSNDIEAVLTVLRPWQEKIQGAESESIMGRWEFGRVLVDRRSGRKQLPKGMRADLADRLGLESSEITRRMQLAETFNSPEELKAACERCGGSWRRIIREELIKAARLPDEIAWGERMKWRLDQIKKDATDAGHQGELVELLEAMLHTLKSESVEVAA